ncbi:MULTISPECIES: monofunctional biosynthetic peptidoglycan transglycosylase [unclassified Motilimonas]|uniref:monofunctional biosynthetic peptidoglycan transglycosylase n=1 Tax=Motilimonas TaxID=1914248 RepID=UPI001E551BED|nr:MULTISPECIES: monofunctional biosynthetic peptidoglycan transglycosylase [unclassified Motilimonas]MCE0558234.1 monofunctional biosynthetic peptidoglycan transglycosylase [Motilimonas sp. E26]MDO6526414.1 monofunctional biosynthetic peptidoglycan transglycosylase [Motilimonas sp. 1_MG-2023]
MKWLLKACFTVGVFIVVSSLLITFPLKYINPIFWSWQLQREFNPPALYPEDAKYHWVSIEDISSSMQLAVIAAEDQLFLSHNGIDVESTKQAIDDMISGKRFRGASTLSQQTVKNLYLWSGKSIPRKAIEAWLTLLIEWQWNKQRILEIYLNIVEFGPGIYGVEAASQHYFGVSAKQLSAAQSARLAAVLPNPYRFSAAAPSTYQIKREQWIRQQMRQLGIGYLKAIK